MTSVGCWLSECKWCENGYCNRGSITIGEDLECEDFVHFCEDYTDAFWKACLKDGKKFRKFVKHGKKIEYNGYVFYTDERITEDGWYYLTEERTGMGIGAYNQLEQRWDKFIARVGEYPDVTDLPIEERSENGT
jgi:hypothetical protein